MKPQKVSIFVLALATTTLLHLLHTTQSAHASSIQLVGLTDNNTLLLFNSNNSSRTQTRAVTGIMGNLVGIDFRPANGDLFGVTDANNIYTIDPNTGAATLISNNPTPFALSGTSFGVDFNPNPDRIRVVSNTGQNLRLNPNTGGIGSNPNGTPAIDTSLAYASTDPNSRAIPDIVAAAYTNSFSPSPDANRRTTLYNIDRTLDILVTQGSANFLTGDPSPAVSPNTGQLFTVGSLGVDFGDGGFDIFSTNKRNTITNTAFAASGSNLYTINLSTGAAKTLGTIGKGNANIIGLSARAVPEPGTVGSLLGFGALGLLVRCRRQVKN